MDIFVYIIDIFINIYTYIIYIYYTYIIYIYYIYIYIYTYIYIYIYHILYSANMEPSNKVNATRL